MLAPNTVPKSLEWYPTLTVKGRTQLNFDLPGESWPVSLEPIIQLGFGQERILPDSLVLKDGRLKVRFPKGAHLEFAVHPNSGFVIFELVQAELPPQIDRMQFTVALPYSAEIMELPNAGEIANQIVCLSAAEPNMRAFVKSWRSDGDDPGCAHELTKTNQAQTGSFAAQFSATARASGWVHCGVTLPWILDLTGLKAVRVWVYGQSKGQLLRIHLSDDDSRGHCVAYIPIPATGWEQVTRPLAVFNAFQSNRVAKLDLWYSLTAGQSVSCIVDRIEAIVERDGREIVVTLEDFAADSRFWSPTMLNLKAIARHGLRPARFGLIVAPEDEFLDTMARFEEAAGLPSPRPGGVWNKKSPWIKRSYLFITEFSASQADQDQVVAMADQGGFDMILINQTSWNGSMGHYPVNINNFSGGIDALKRTVQQLKQEGFHVGFQLLCPLISPEDSYITPRPDPRLYKDAFVQLGDAIDENADIVPTDVAPADFLATHGGTVLQIGDELIAYQALKLAPPYGFEKCQRGIRGTKRAPHAKGDVIAHVRQGHYGNFLYDIDTSLLDEVAANFARVANACNIDMVYFDGAENFRRSREDEYRFYRGRMLKTFFDKLIRKDILFQASSADHYSWHILARSAIVDGTGDFKVGLEGNWKTLETSFSRGAMPLDIGWYGCTPTGTPDMLEYVLGATIAYNASLSFQVALKSHSTHPFLGESLDLIARYERLRLSGRVPPAMRERLRIDPAFTKAKTAEERAHLRHEYRLLIGSDGHETFQRVVYEPWYTVNPRGGQTAPWRIHVENDATAVGVQIHVTPERWLAAGPSYDAVDAMTDDVTAQRNQDALTVKDPWIEIDNQRMAWSGSLTAGQFLFLWPGEVSRRYGPSLKKPETGPTVSNLILNKGEYDVKFGCANPLLSSINVRVTLQPPERYKID